MSSIGPALPPHLRKTVPEAANPETQEASDDEDDFGPALPPHLAAARGKKLDPVAAGRSRPTVQAEPSRPPSAQQPVFTKAPDLYGDDDDDEDDYQVGPSLAAGSYAGPSTRSAAELFMEREARWAREREDAAKPKEIKREEWMLVPPKNSTLAETLGDPLKIKARGFARSADDAPRERDQTLWTETPLQRQQRLKDEMSGKKRKLENADDAGKGDDLEELKRRRRDEDIQASVREHNSKHRAESMVDSHSKSKTRSTHSASGKDTNGKVKDTDEPPPIWDRDVHMGVTGKLMQDKDRIKMLKEAKNLGDRFGRGGSYA